MSPSTPFAEGVEAAVLGGSGCLDESLPAHQQRSPDGQSTVGAHPDFADPGTRPQGAFLQADGSVLWRIWAPKSKNVVLVLDGPNGCQEVAMEAEGGGYFTARHAGGETVRYKYRLDDGRAYPDPVSRWQPDGVHEHSAVFSPEAYRWSDRHWRGVSRHDLVIYELHVGTFTEEGTFAAIIPRLAELRALGITALEIMPIAQFPGDRNWGYDGVYPFAAQNSYGGPHGFQQLVDAAHNAGMAVLLDVVYNHFGPEGCYLSLFGPYFNELHKTGWGHAVNFDGPDSDPVRQLVIDNAVMWVRDFHVDGLRLDAVHAIFDLGARHVLADLATAVNREAARQGRIVHVIAESNQNDVRLVRSQQAGGLGLDGVWTDDFHHSVHSLLTGEVEGYFRDFGGAEHLVKAFNDAFVYDGGYSPFRRRRYGSRVGNTDRSRFVVCIQNHDQIGNRVRGDRVKASMAPEAQRLACALMLLSPYTPMLFMGEEYSEQSPFPFFCSFGDPALIEAVREGRREEFAALKFEWGNEVPDPHDNATYLSAKLAWQWPTGSFHAQLRQLYHDLLAARRRWSALRDRQHTKARLADAHDPSDHSGPVLLLERGSGDSLIAVANLTADEQPRPEFDLGGRDLILSTEAECYGGRRRDQQLSQPLFPYELLIFGRDEWLR